MIEYSKLPKIELHSHLDCCLSLEAARRIEPSITPESYEREFVAPRRCASLADYLTYTLNYRALLQSERALRIAVEDVFEQMARDGVVYGELRFAPLAQLEQGLAAEEVVEVVAGETSRQIERTGVECSLILCTLRHFSGEDSMATAGLVARYADQGPVAALDIAGDELGYPLATHLPALRYVTERGLPITVHAGEAGGPDNVWEALRETGTRRIGHGVHSIEDERLVDHLRAEWIHLEICPSSNVQTAAVASYGAHPVDQLLRRGVPVGISTDTRAVTAVTLGEEYRGLVDGFGWTLADLQAVNEHALAASFAPEPVKRRLGQLLRQSYADAGS